MAIKQEIREEWLRAGGQAEDRLFLAKLWDLLLRAEREAWPVSGFFLDERQQTILSRLMRKFSSQLKVFCCFWGGFSEAVRKIPIFIPESLRKEAFFANSYNEINTESQATPAKPKGDQFVWPAYWGEDPLVYCRAYFGREALSQTAPLAAQTQTHTHTQTPGHRDLLGALLGLGVDRSRAGDLVLHEEGADFVLLREISALVVQELRQAGRYPLRVAALANAAELKLPSEKLEVNRVSVASTRLDNVVAAVWHLGREQAKDLILGGQVSVDGLVEEKASRVVTEGQVLRCRGYGKAKLLSLGSVTRKGRIWLNLGIYR